MYKERFFSLCNSHKSNAFEQHEKRLVKIIRALCNTPRGMHPIERYFFASKEMENVCYYIFLSQDMKKNKGKENQVEKN